MFPKDRASAAFVLSHSASNVSLSFELPGAVTARSSNGAVATAQVGDATVIWTSYADRLKEDIILARRPAEDRVVFGMSQTGLRFVPDGKGGYVALDARGERRFHVLAPTVTDAAGRSGAARLTLSGHSATIDLDSTFMAAATYPVTVDPTSVYGAAVLQNVDLAGYWRLNEANGAAVVADSSGFGNTGNVTGTVTLGAAGLLYEDADTAMQANGGGAQLPTSESLTFGSTQSFSIEAWMKTTSGAAQMVFSQQQCGPSAIQLYISGGTVVFRLYGPTGGEVNVSGGLVNDGDPHHLVGVRDTSADKVRLYVDGLLLSEVTDSTEGSLTQLPNQTWIGQRYWCGSTNPFSGTIDEVAVYRAALTPALVQEHYDAGAPPLPAPGVPPNSAYGHAIMSDQPIAYWRLGETAGIRAQDATGHNYIGVASGPVNSAQGLLLGDEDGARQFSGGGIALPSTDDLVFDATESLSVEAWVKTSSTGTQMVFSQQQCGAGVIQLYTSGSRATFRIGDSTAHEVSVTGGTVTDGVTHHLVGVRDAVAKRVRLYADGTLVQDLPDPTVTQLTVLPTQTWIGRRYPCAYADVFAGTIDDVAVYNRPLSVDDVREHYWLGKGDPTPVVQMNALPSSSTTSPLAISWTPEAATAAAIKDYTITYQVDEAPAAVLGTVSSSTTSIDVWTGNDAQYRFKIQPTSWTGKAGPETAWTTTRTSFSPYTTDNPGDDDDLVDPTAQLPCFPPISQNPDYPNYANVVSLLLLHESLCGEEEQQVAWQQNPPIKNLLCPGQLNPRPSPGSVLLSPLSATCQELGSAGGTVGLAGAQAGVRERGERAASAIMNHPRVQALGIGTPAFVAIEQGVERALRAMEGFIRSGRYRQAEGYVAELWGQYEIIDRIGVSAAQSQVGMVAIQQAVPPSAKMADATLRLYQNTQGGAIVRVIWDSKNWSQQYLDFMLSAAGNARFIRLVQQIQGYQLDVENRVVLQFTQRGNTATNLNNLWQQLSDPAHGLDMTRISLRTHKMWETVPSQTFNSGVH